MQMQARPSTTLSTRMPTCSSRTAPPPNCQQRSPERLSASAQPPVLPVVPVPLVVLVVLVVLVLLVVLVVLMVLTLASQMVGSRPLTVRQRSFAYWHLRTLEGVWH